MSHQSSDMPVPERSPGGGRSRRARPYRLWYRVTYLANPSMKYFNYTIHAGDYHSEDERQRVMDKVLREQHGRWPSDRKSEVEFFFEKPARQA